MDVCEYADPILVDAIKLELESIRNEINQELFSHASNRLDRVYDVLLFGSCHGLLVGYVPELLNIYQDLQDLLP